MPLVGTGEVGTGLLASGEPIPTLDSFFFFKKFKMHSNYSRVPALLKLVTQPLHVRASWCGISWVCPCSWRACNRRAVAGMPVPWFIRPSASSARPRACPCACASINLGCPWMCPDACLTVVNCTHLKLRRFAILYRKLEILHRQSHSRSWRSPNLVFLKPLYNLFFFFRTQRMFPKSLPFTSSDYRC